jgi:hypothetical protein
MDYYNFRLVMIVSSAILSAHFVNDWKRFEGRNIRQNNVKGNHHMCMCVCVFFCFVFFWGEGVIRKGVVYGCFNKSGFSNIRNILFKISQRKTHVH